MDVEKIRQGLNDAGEWIVNVAGSEADKPHIQAMLEALDQASELLSRKE